MTSEEENERLLTHKEVEDILKESLNKPDKIYHGPEEDQSSDQFIHDEMAPSEDDEEVEVDPLTKLSFEKRSAMEHVTGFGRVKKKNADKMIKKLVKMERVTETHAFKIAELMPRDETELRPVFAKDRFTLEPEELKQILDLIDENRD